MRKGLLFGAALFILGVVVQPSGEELFVSLTSCAVRQEVRDSQARAAEDARKQLDAILDSSLRNPKIAGIRRRRFKRPF